MDTDFSRLAAILGKREIFMAHTPCKIVQALAVGTGRILSNIPVLNLSAKAIKLINK